MAVTIKDIANVCGVSYSTVSRALSNHPAISDKTKSKINRIAQSMGYKPNAMARGLVMKKSHTLGLLIPDITNPFWPQLAKGVEDYANELGYQVLLCNTDLKEGKEILYISTLLERRVDGLIMAPSSPDIQKMFSNADSPVVYLDIGKAVDGQHSIQFDNQEGAYLGTKYLMSLGHERIAFVHGDDNRTTYQDRLKGYTKALQEGGFSSESLLVYKTKTSHIEDGYAATKKILQSSPLPTAIFAVNDMLAIGVLEGLDEAGLRVPDFMSVIGFDDIIPSSLPNIRLTTVRQPQYEIGQAAAKLLIYLIDQIEGKKTTSSIPEIKPELVIRNTCAPPRNSN